METTIYWGYIGIMENEMETTIYWGYIGIMENKSETTTYWGYIGIMENEMETTIYWGYIVDFTPLWATLAQSCRIFGVRYTVIIRN